MVIELLDRPGEGPRHPGVPGGLAPGLLLATVAGEVCEQPAGRADMCTGFSVPVWLGIPALIVSVAAPRGGETVHLRGYGDADPSGRPVTAETPFLIGSVSKPFTVNVVLQLVDEWVLSLDERVLP